MQKILIIEDEENISNELKTLLESSGYEAIILKDFKNSLTKIKEIKPDLILLDINIPYLNGQILLKEIRKEENTPVIMVTSKNNETEEVLSMSYGADDYITKPYNPTILLLRINAVLKRLERNMSSIKYKDILINTQKGVLIKDNKEIILTKNEMIILNYLIQKRGKIVTRDELMTDLWNNSEYVNDNALTVNISRLRSKLDEIGCENAIETRKGLGYILL